MMPDLKTITINLLVFTELLILVSCKGVELQSSVESQNKTEIQLSRVLRETETETGRGMMDHDYHDVQPKATKPWLGYYDFLITEGSYKFWVVFQLFTIAVLIYSAFAAIYYAKYTITDYENYDDYLFRRSARSTRSIPTQESAFLGLPVETYLRIFNAIANYGNKLNQS